jgi:hypothetical protein
LPEVVPVRFTSVSGAVRLAHLFALRLFAFAHID